MGSLSPTEAEKKLKKLNALYAACSCALALLFLFCFVIAEKTSNGLLAFISIVLVLACVIASVAGATFIMRKRHIIATSVENTESIEPDGLFADIYADHQSGKLKDRITHDEIIYEGVKNENLIFSYMIKKHEINLIINNNGITVIGDEDTLQPFDFSISYEGARSPESFYNTLNYKIEKAIRE